MRIVLLSLVSLFVWLSGCTHPQIFKEMGADFQGIAKRMSASRPLQVLVVHGMGPHDPAYADALLAALVEYAGLRGQGCRDELNPIRHPDYKDIDYGSVTRCRYRGPRGQDVSVYILTWSPLTRLLKHDALGYDWTEKSFIEDRLPLNHAMKHFLVDKSLSDAILYIGPLREHLQYSIQQALCVMMREHRVQDQVCGLAESFLGETNFEQIVVIAQGLGGTMVFQTIDALHQQVHHLTGARLSDQFARASARFAADTSTVFLLANSWPMFGLTEIEGPVAGPLHSSVERFIRLRSEHRRKNQIQESLQIVAFSDPNDLLSYPIPESAADDLPEGLRDQVLFSNVLLTIADAWIFGTLADPVKAHTGYAHNRTVLKMISCGSRTQASC